MYNNVYSYYIILYLIQPMFLTIKTNNILFLNNKKYLFTHINPLFLLY